MQHFKKIAVAAVAFATPVLASATTIETTPGSLKPNKNVYLSQDGGEFIFSVAPIGINQVNTADGSVDCRNCSFDFEIIASDRDSSGRVSTFANLERGSYRFTLDGTDYSGDIRNPSVDITPNEEGSASTFMGQFFFTAPSELVEQYGLAFNGNFRADFQGQEARGTRINSITFESADVAADVPEPSSIAAFGLGLGLISLGFLSSRRRRG